MQSPINLQVLAGNRPALLLAEAAAWLHDMGKCTDDFIKHEDARGFKSTKSKDKKPGQLNPHKAVFTTSELSSFAFSTERRPEREEEADNKHALHRLLGVDILRHLDKSLTLFDTNYTLRELIYFGRPGFAGKTEHPLGKKGLPADYLGRSHGAAHIEKEEGGDQASAQDSTIAWISTVFGMETPLAKNLTSCLKALPFAELDNWSHTREAVSRNFAQVVADTRRPENEVTLWDWANIVAALYKASLAGALLGYQPQPNDLRWRLLSIQVNGQAFYEHVARLPDLLIRQQLLFEAFEHVRKLLEETYPLGTRVYQDENSSLYVVPNLPGLLNARDENGVELVDCIRARFAAATVNNHMELALSGEIAPEVNFDTREWQAQRPNRTFDIPPVADTLKRPVCIQANAQVVAGWWTDSSLRDVCPVCGLRPQEAPDTKAGKRNVCDVCERRRADRAEAWAVRLDTTIWTDEVADANGRLALVVGQFGLDEWLAGTMVQTLTVVDPATTTLGKTAKEIGKNPSFARLRRVWETTRTFWQSARDVSGPDGKPVLQPAGPRLEIIPQNCEHLDLGHFHTYELVLGRVRLSVVWDSANHRFITCDNLDYLAKPEQLGQNVQQWLDEHETITVEEPAGYGSKNKTWGRITIEPVNELSDAYVPAIPILAEPRTFMALVPANQALEVVKAIKAKYEREMSKVRNRLPLALGVVYFGRRTPLAAALDAGRRMLSRKQDAGSNSEQDAGSNSEQDAGSKWQAASAPGVSDEWVDVTLQGGARKITVRVSAVMGDKTPDVWYPYWRVENSPTGRKRQFTGLDSEHWVHVCDLRQGDQVAFTPSTFDFEHLDTTARRFEVSYDGGRRRGADKRQRPYLLEELEQIEQTWAEISRLSTSQIKMIESLIEGKRRDWLATDTPEAQQTFRQFVRDVLREAKIHSEALERAALSGMLADALELHLTIGKEDPRNPISSRNRVSPGK